MKLNDLTVGNFLDAKNELRFEIDGRLADLNKGEMEILIDHMSDLVANINSKDSDPEESK